MRYSIHSWKTFRQHHVNAEEEKCGQERGPEGQGPRTGWRERMLLQEVAVHQELLRLLSIHGDLHHVLSLHWNTEVRKLVDSNSGAKNSSAVKRQKAAAMSAKAAAAAAKAGIGVQAKGLPVGGSAVALPGKAPPNFGLVAGKQSMAVPMNIPISRPMATSATPARVMKHPAETQPANAIIPVRQDDRRERNLFVQPVNAALLECMLIQATEAEQLGLNELQVGQLVLDEFLCGYKKILEKICEYSKDYY
ncbi:uncharacterized protein Dyak_GE18995, isoform B [Drosophila yakuba]|uniref:Uncharacterized protein, isoform B n=1 Tax=Drosophila yakuba TaxID=7245 RepID=A0A0R1DSZ5_DROYA|nr:uncharacterized protein Dyak_GE18995, isoform B [Drosophila yakuba]